jgi:hypothetical protein
MVDTHSAVSRCADGRLLSTGHLKLCFHTGFFQGVDTLPDGFMERLVTKGRKLGIETHYEAYL